MALRHKLPPEAQNLPALLRAMAEEHGYGKALQFANDFGGLQITMPATAKPDHAIAQSVGLPVLRWLVEKHGGEKFDIPIGPASSYGKLIARTRRLVEERLPTTEIVRRAGVTTRTVRRHRNPKRKPGAQPRLFD